MIERIEKIIRQWRVEIGADPDLPPEQAQLLPPDRRGPME